MTGFLVRAVANLEKTNVSASVFDHMHINRFSGQSSTHSNASFAA